MVEFRALFDDRRVNAAVAWVATIAILLAAIGLFARGALLWAVFAVLVLAVVLLPPILTRDVTTTLPGELVTLVAFPVVLSATDLFAQTTPFATMAGLALLIVLVLDAFTSLEMVPRFAILFVVVTTMAFAGSWAMGEYAADLLLGTTFIDGQREMNVNLLTATLVGLIAGIVFAAYFRETDGDAPLSGRRFPFVLGTPTTATEGSGEMSGKGSRETSGAASANGANEGSGGEGDEKGTEMSEESNDTKSDDVVEGSGATEEVEDAPAFRVAIRALQVVLVAIFLYSIVTVQWSLVINSGVPLALSFLPAIVRWRYGYPMHAGLALLIALAATLHAVGALGPYQQTDWYDTVTHALSSTLVAGVGYAIAHSIELHTDRVSFSPRFRGVFVVLFVLAVGVLWEIMEFTSGIAAGLLGGEVLAQYGVSDIVKDLTFNPLGAIIVALWGTALFRQSARRLTDNVGQLFS